MEAYQQRVIDEAGELRDRRAKLFAFIHNGDGTFGKLPADERQRLHDQLVVMDQYALILQERINHFPVQKAMA